MAWLAYTCYHLLRGFRLSGNYMIVYYFFSFSLPLADFFLFSTMRCKITQSSKYFHFSTFISIFSLSPAFHFTSMITSPLHLCLGLAPLHLLLGCTCTLLVEVASLLCGAQRPRLSVTPLGVNGHCGPKSGSHGMPNTLPACSSLVWGHASRKLHAGMPHHLYFFKR